MASRHWARVSRSGRRIDARMLEARQRPVPDAEVVDQSAKTTLRVHDIPAPRRRASVTATTGASDSCVSATRHAVQIELQAAARLDQGHVLPLAGRPGVPASVSTHLPAPAPYAAWKLFVLAASCCRTKPSPALSWLPKMSACTFCCLVGVDPAFHGKLVAELLLRDSGVDPTLTIERCTLAVPSVGKRDRAVFRAVSLRLRRSRPDPRRNAAAARAARGDAVRRRFRSAAEPPVLHRQR